LKAIKIDCSDCKNHGKSIFCQLEKSPLLEVSEHKIMNIYKKGQILFHEGNPAFGAYCLSEGKVKLSKTNENGKETLLRIAGPGELVGFQNILANGLSDVTATALEETKICFIDRPFLNGFIQKEASCAMELLSHLAQDMADLQNRVNGFQTKSVSERVAMTLLDLSEKYGVETPQGIRLDITLSREDMASLLGMATETLIRELSIMKDEGSIAQDGKTIIITSKKALSRQAGVV
jgi:CRP-like cAMP-binding protein